MKASYPVNLSPLLVARLGLDIERLAMRYPEQLETLLLEGMEAGVFDAVTASFGGEFDNQPGGEKWDLVTLTDWGKDISELVTPEVVCGPGYQPQTRDDRAFINLWFILLMLGKSEVSTYGSGSAIGRHLSLLHVVGCGIKRDASSTPTDREWSYFNDTYTSNTPASGLVGTATCLCGTIEDMEITFEYTEQIGLATVLRVDFDVRSLVRLLA